MGYDGLWDRRRGGPSLRRVPLETAQQVLLPYGKKHFDFNVSNFHEKLREQHDIGMSCARVNLALQCGVGALEEAARRAPPAAAAETASGLEGIIVL